VEYTKTVGFNADLEERERQSEEKIEEAKTIFSAT